MKRNNSFQSIGRQFRTQQDTRRRRILATLLAAAVTASPIGAAPTASAKGIVLPREHLQRPAYSRQNVHETAAAGPSPRLLRAPWIEAQEDSHRHCTRSQARFTRRGNQLDNCST